MTKRLTAALCCLFLLAAAGCQTAKNVEAEFDPAQRPEQLAYVAVIDKYLAQKQDHDGAAMIINVAALPLNATVRQAIIQRRVAALDLGPKAQAQEQAAADKAVASHYDVMLSVYVPEDKWNNLAGQDPAFLVYLVGPDGRKLSPVDRRHLHRRTAMDQALYPFWGPWSKLYLLRFALADPDGAPLLADGQNQATLLITGAPGSVKLPLVVR